MSTTDFTQDGQPQGGDDSQQQTPAWMDEYIDDMFANSPPPEVAPQGSYVPESPHEAAVPQEVAAELQDLRDERFQRDVADFIEEYPTFNDPEAAHHLVEVAQARALQIGQPEAWRDPGFLRQVVNAEGGDAAFATQGRRVAEGILKAAGKTQTDSSIRWW